MLATINANSLDDFTVDKWLDNNGDCDDLDLLRSDLALDNAKDFSIDKCTGYDSSAPLAAN